MRIILSSNFDVLLTTETHSFSLPLSKITKFEMTQGAVDTSILAQNKL